MKKYLLFDLDGTLTDSKVGITTCVQYALASFGIEEPDLTKLEKFIGPPLRDSFKNYYGFDEEQAQRAVEKYRERFQNTGIFENEVYEGIPEMLKALQSKGVYLAVASSKPQIYVERILEHFDLKKYFTVVVGSELDGSRENKDEVVMETLNRLFAYKPIQKSQVYMIGDRSYDVEGAKAYGIESVGVTYGFGDMEELKAAKADYIVRSVEELQKFLLRGSEESEAVQNTTKKITFGDIWPVLYLFLLFLAVRSIVMYLIELLSVAMWDMELPGTVDRFLFVRDQAVLDADNATFAFTGNQIALKAALGFAAGAFAIRKETKKLVEKTAEDNRLSYIKKDPASSVALYAFAVMGAALGLNLLLKLVGMTDASEAYKGVQAAQYSASFLVGLIAFGLVSPVAEEMMFRGILHNYLKRFFPIRVAMLLSSALFGMYHLNRIQGIYGFLMGCLIVYGYEYFGNFKAALLTHAGANILVYCLTYTPLVNTRFVSWPVCGVFAVLFVGCFSVLSRRKNVL